MAPAQVMDLPQTKPIYNHKKFQCNRYSHKKFGTRLSPSLAKPSQYPSNLYEMDKQPTANKNTNASATKYKSDIFRPYALDESSVSRKRKHQEIQLESTNQQHEQQQFNDSNKSKIFAAASPYTNTLDTLPCINFPAVQVNFPYLMPPPPTVIRQQQCQFNSHTLAIILQKQQAALYLGEMLKRHPQFNLHNLWRN